MKVGNSIVYKADGSTGIIIAVEQYGNTPTYVINWDDKCPMTGLKRPTPVLITEVRKLREGE